MLWCSLMAIELLPILYSIIHTEYKIVKSRRATVFSVSEDVDVDPFGCEKRVFIAPRAASAKERATHSPLTLLTQL